VGGISSGERAKRAVGEGANLVKVNTALRYQGPKLIRDLKQALAI
jgi:dihydroorotate dehydrogenase